jgi:putative acetyltransferase
MTDIQIHHSQPDDMAFIEQMYPQAFPDEDLLPLVRHLLTKEPDILSLVASADGIPAGHILFTLCSMTGIDTKLALLAPLAVALEWQRHGVGTALIHEGLKHLKSAGIAQVYVLGDPAYYGRAGFKPESGVAPPYPLPDEYRDAWQSLSLDPATPAPRGVLAVPIPWADPKYWS